MISKHLTYFFSSIGNKPVFQCEECGQIYGRKQQVLDHIKSDHAEQVQQHQQQQLQIQVFITFYLIMKHLLPCNNYFLLVVYYHFNIW